MVFIECYHSFCLWFLFHIFSSIKQLYNLITKVLPWYGCFNSEVIEEETSCPIPEFDFYDKWFFNVVEYAVNNTAVKPCTSPPKIFSKWTRLPDRKGHVLKIIENGTKELRFVSHIFSNLHLCFLFWNSIW